MPVRQPIKMIDVRTALGPGELGPFPWDQYERHCLAQGDSWFSIGALPPQFTTNLLIELQLARRTVVTQCARPGKVLRRFTDTTREQDFLRMIKGPLAWRWHAILISGVGNDLIDAVGASPNAPLQLRLLRTPAERGTGPLAAADYLSEAGWTTFSTHIRAVFNALIDLRDSGVNRQVPLVMHNYARMMPRPAPAGPLSGPWLLPSFEAYAVPLADRLAVSDELTGRMDRLLRDMIAARQAADPATNLHLVDTRVGAGITLADAGSAGTSGDWANEIHLTPGGYRKCAVAWADVLDPTLG
jgi:hypothetical protein